jgi:putative redox protein
MSIDSRKVVFEGAHGQPLDARLDTPTGVQPVAYALLAHCFSCSKELIALSRISQHLAHIGIAVLRFDFTGLGHSEGEFANTNFSSNVGDLVAAASFLAEEYQAPSILIGHSFGGTAVLKAAGELDEIRAVCTIGAPFDPEHVLNLILDDIDEIEESGTARVELAGREFTMQRQFLADVRAASLADDIKALDAALLIMHSPQDDTVGVDNARLIFEAARHSKSFVSLDGADHLLSDPSDAQYVAEVLAAWSTRYVEYAKPGGDKPAPSDPSELVDRHPDEVLVLESGEGKYVNQVMVGRHQFYADEPVDVGGNDAGPDPYDLITAALGACTSMTLRMYAERQGWPLEQVQVRLNHAKIHATSEDFSGDHKGQKIDKITRAITLLGELDDEQRRRLVEIAERCPVHQTLLRENLVETSLRDDEQG